jgi:hypothetical protein
MITFRIKEILLFLFALEYFNREAVAYHKRYVADDEGRVQR